jgi:hypothetical protein
MINLVGGSLPQISGESRARHDLDQVLENKTASPLSGDAAESASPELGAKPNW